MGTEALAVQVLLPSEAEQPVEVTQVGGTESSALLKEPRAFPKWKKNF